MCRKHKHTNRQHTYLYTPSYAFSCTPTHSSMDIHRCTHAHTVTDVYILLQMLHCCHLPWRQSAITVEQAKVHICWKCFPFWQTDWSSYSGLYAHCYRWRQGLWCSVLAFWVWSWVVKLHNYLGLVMSMYIKYTTAAISSVEKQTAAHTISLLFIHNTKVIMECACAYVSDYTFVGTTCSYSRLDNVMPCTSCHLRSQGSDSVTFLGGGESYYTLLPKPQI